MCEKLNQHGNLVTEQKLSYPWRNSFFAVFFIEQRKLKDSKYAMYLKSLPQDLSNYPILFGEDQINKLKGSQMVEKIQKKKEMWTQDYNALLAVEPTLKDVCSLQEFLEGKVLASTRAYDIVYTDGSTR